MIRMRVLVPLVALLTAVSGMLGPAAWAWWSGNVSVTSTVTAYTVPAPTLSCGGLGVLSVTFNWTAVAGATDYVLTAGGTTYSPQTTTSKTIVTAISGGTATVVARHAYGTNIWTSANSNSRSFTVAVVSVCG